MMDKRKIICTVYYGPVIPPTHGASTVGQEICNALDNRLNKIIRSNSYNNKSIFASNINRFLVFYNSLIMACKMITKKKNIYVIPDDGEGLYLNIAVLAVLLIRSQKIYIHHHSFRYLTKRNFAMSILCQILSKRVCHIFLCDYMRLKFEAIYPLYAFKIVGNGWLIKGPIRTPKSKVISRDSPLVLGLLSNLNLDKGVGRFLEILSELLRLSQPVTGLLLGPANENVADLITKVQLKYGHNLLRWHGPVFGSSKEYLLSEIDVFLFSSSHPSEAQPLVVFEAIASGAVPIVSSLGCLKDDLPAGSIISDSHEEFVQKAVCLITDYCQGRRDLLSERTTAQNRLAELRDDHRGAFEKVIDEFLGIC